MIEIRTRKAIKASGTSLQMKMNKHRKITSIKNCPVVSSARSSSVYHGLIERNFAQNRRKINLNIIVAGDAGQRPASVPHRGMVSEFLKEASSQTRKMRYPTLKLTDCGKTCTLTKLQTAEPEKFEAK